MRTGNRITKLQSHYSPTLFSAFSPGALWSMEMPYYLTVDQRGLHVCVAGRDILKEFLENWSLNYSSQFVLAL